MQEETKAKHLNFTHVDWRILLLVCIACFYLAVFSDGILKGKKASLYRGDYLAFWSVGKIARENGFSKVYDLTNLQNVQSQAAKSLGFRENIDGPANPTIPVPYFSFFVLPFILLSRISLVYGYWIWNLFNLIILIGYLAFFFRRISAGSAFRISSLFILSTILISYPVFINFLNAQVEVFLVVCVGEFIRSAVNKKPILSGLWLGGLLLKPQLLILIIPIILVKRHWKVLLGFVISSGIIFLSSSLLSGFAGMKALIDLWTKYSIGIASNSPEAMINWRMIAININTFTNTPVGWFIAASGMLLTLLVVYFLIRKNAPFGSPRWVMNMLGVFSATLLLTWHSHYHMAMVLIPFLIYAVITQLLPEKILYVWAIGAPFMLLGIMNLNIVILVVSSSSGMDYNALKVTGFSGFILTLVILFSSLHSSSYQSIQK
jgi:hypothetical protein